MIDFSDDKFQTTVAKAKSLAQTLEAIAAGQLDPSLDTFSELSSLAVGIGADLALVV